jgi:excisionase family DNA binding protein
MPVKEASILVGYSQQYLRRLLRQKKLGGIKVGQVWLLEVISLDTYLALFNRVLDRRSGPRT